MRLIFANQEETILEPNKLIERLTHLKKDVSNQGFIFQLYVNGNYFNQEMSLLKALFEEIDTIQVQAMQPIELVLEGVTDAVDYLPRLIQGLMKTSQHFHAGEDQEGNQLFQQALEGFNWLQTILVGLSHYLNQETLDDVTKSTYAEVMERYTAILAELLEAWENYDTVLIGDLLEYELVPFLQELYLVIQKILESFQK